MGRLDADTDSPHYRFRYTQGALKAQNDLGFTPLLAFPEFEKVYESDDLFPLFKNRVLSFKRDDFQQYLHWLDLENDQADPVSILSVSGGERVTDNLEVFPKVTADAAGNFHVRFFLHGLRHLGEKAIQRTDKLKEGEELRILVELNNPATRLAVPLLTDDYQMIGWAPRYLVEDLIRCVPNAPELSAKIARINAPTAPLNQRILIDYTGRAPEGTQPMSTPDFEPLLG
ncbi:DNA-binding protein [Oscillatoria laete-virens NRMC-F 0139]|nr:DNA-binding protein [Oscillatoria laete-virens]MDL5054667.1 DNA-binding protein [Oscillatoria laete-virens NRMC-F 0139]